MTSAWDVGVDGVEPSVHSVRWHQLALCMVQDFADVVAQFLRTATPAVVM
jgi:hypothetical protein